MQVQQIYMRDASVSITVLSGNSIGIDLAVGVPPPTHPYQTRTLALTHPSLSFLFPGLLGRCVVAFLFAHRCCVFVTRDIPAEVEVRSLMEHRALPLGR